MPVFPLLPFVGVLLSVALLPLWTPTLWQHHTGKMLAPFPCILALYAALCGNFAPFCSASCATLLCDYLPFLVLMASLYGIAGGIHITVPQRTTPLLNTIVLAMATLAAGWIGTTGASMACIRPFLRLNAGNTHKAHLVVFFIFLVSNIGGGLSPLGDPPLFMGFLQGIDFFWVSRNLCWPVFGTSVALLGIFFVLDTFLKKQDHQTVDAETTPFTAVHCEGKRNVLLLAGAVIIVALTTKDLGTFSVFGVSLPIIGLFRDGGLLLLLGISMKNTPWSIREHNTFEWEPIHEIAKIFFAIFITLIPVEAALRGETPIARVLTEALSVDSALSPWRCFWVSGVLSSFLDNTPTYLFFFHLFGGNPSTLMTTQAPLLMAISLGSVFMGAMTYIGNAPNLMVMAIARKRFPKKMPSFFGYMGWSVALLLPIFGVLSFVLFP
ncbi:MAG: sodium:proton antiporter [Holosporales bacterium]|jgi:Na+/H+ antiporter NhaD/arsenite permease-like protein|nr:sodium:proton antiporter [Holosporales bacterium]